MTGKLLRILLYSVDAMNISIRIVEVNLQYLIKMLRQIFGSNIKKYLPVDNTMNE